MLPGTGPSAAKPPAKSNRWREGNGMRIENGICFPDTGRRPLLKVVACRALEASRLRIRFDTGEVRDADLTPLLALPAFAALADERTFHSFTLDHGIVSWLDGDLDIAPEWLFDHGETVAENAADFA